MFAIYTYFAAALCAQVISAEQVKQREPLTRTHLRRRLTSRDVSGDDASDSSSSSGGGGSSSSSGSGRSTPSVTKFARTIIDVLKGQKRKGIYHDDLRDNVFDKLDVKGKDKDEFDKALERLEDKGSIEIGKHRVKLIVSQDHTDQSKTGEEMSDDSSDTDGDDDKSGGGGGNRVDEEGDQSNNVISDEENVDNAEAENRIDDEGETTDDPDPLNEGTVQEKGGDAIADSGSNGDSDSGTSDNEGTGDENDSDPLNGGTEDGDGNGGGNTGGDARDADDDSGTNDKKGTEEENDGEEGTGTGTGDGSTGSDGEDHSDSTGDLGGEEDMEGEGDSNKVLPDENEFDVEDGGMISNGDPCQSDEECSSGACVVGMCSSPLSDGDACDSDGDCVSGACGSTSLSPGSPKICCATGSRLQDICTGQENGAICAVTSVARQSLSDDVLLNGICASGFCNKDGFCDDSNQGEAEDTDSQQDASGTDGENEEDIGTGTEPDADGEEDVTSRASEGGGSCNTGCKVGASVGSVAAVGAVAAAVAAKKRKKDDEE